MDATDVALIRKTFESALARASGVADATAAGRPIGGPAPPLGLAAGTGRVSGIAGGPSVADGCRWEAVALAARRAVAHELCGLGQVMLDSAAAYVTDRHQFGR